LIAIDFRPDGRYVVFVPKRLSRSGKREGHYFRSEEDAEEFVAGFEEEHEEFGPLALTPAERYYVALAKAELGGWPASPCSGGIRATKSCAYIAWYGT
jgi:hypothetical protein